LQKFKIEIMRKLVFVVVMSLVVNCLYSQNRDLL